MTDIKILEEQLAIGRTLIISASTPGGHVQLNAKIISLGGHHFKVQTSKAIPQHMLVPQQSLKIRLMGEAQSTLPMTCRFLRLNEKRPTEIILSFPDGEWITNRRAFVRAQIKMPVTITRHSGQRIEGRTIDISGGGTLCTLNSSLNPGELIFLKLGPVPESEEVLEFDAKMVRAVQMNVNRRGDTEPFTAYALKFIKAPTRAQNRVCKMVIVEQFEERRAELREMLGKDK